MTGKGLALPVARQVIPWVTMGLFVELVVKEYPATTA